MQQSGMSTLQVIADIYLDVAQLPAMALCMDKLEDLTQTAIHL